jgi:hypothetical protein
MSSIRLIALGVIAGAMVSGGAVAWASNGGASQPSTTQQTAPVGNGPSARPNVQPNVVANAKPESVFTPVAPCRAVDTRSGGGTLATGVARTFYVGGTANFSGQGGQSGGCGVPTTATAVALTITAVSPTHEGYLRAWSATGSEPTSAFMNYGTAYNASGSGQVPISTAGQIKIRNESSTTQVLVDISGYYSAQISALLNPTGGIYSGSARVLSSVNTGTGDYLVTVDRDLTGCTAIASIDGGPYIAAAFISGSTVYANTYTTGGTLLNLYWTLIVDC